MIPEGLKEKTGEIPEYFKKLGYQVTWDFNNLSRWWEILKDKQLIVQFDMDIPLSAILEDFKCFYEGKNKGTSTYDYHINIGSGEHKEFRNLLEKMFGAL